MLGGALVGTALWVTTPAGIQLPRPMGQVAASGRTAGTGPAAVPVHLAIPALNVAASVVPVRAEAGLLGVPRSINEVGWWAGGGVPGAPTGTVVIDGHVDGATSGLGALWPLRSAQIGDQITLKLANGDTVGYRVRGVRSYLKAELPASLFAGVKGTAVLAMITCGGPFDRATGHYADNVVVYAVPG